ncbi:cytochrome d ubiquinol oxidase subunit II [Sphingomonas koreensis]|jgi:cytochrome d ubiquinol oxidase subunit II|uniref:Cytochrome d ubiquinol oxidase subunit II n=1 Tax=Sphingomonas koreensis TaxID=93064 RepID=A0A1L6JDA4_9SPHN|nr:cytochrome d ubiquinol oxidase subunit II [Sphingomonas koreensis]APR53921.1 cytochrome d ubiquinol oxidase subunit II [Sphingomonas koreensis]MDC7808869.1 cytochrome d ubiquinol oxidase subunit II [Sphingomonas koreensis]RSU18989.1 cytochrome d ubiquinol oxidase subunit II [Sphingomonas koreensis]RSU24064.1 cytochrome d ubiquinol oxidase subunit II [Sphingomonas koreensis]RSU26315.1 cytochrome d ubiquinol oxidase subunit II [Sphingomonas koreensis]
MNAVDFDLATVWAFIIAFAVFAYIVMDGFDLGIGILFPTFKVGQERDTAMNSIAPVWDGNETWLVLGGGGLMAAFPLAYGVVMTALYPPIIAMVLGLVFRGVAFEARWRDPDHRRWWDIAFAGGSIVASFCQGVTLGAMLQGIAIENRVYAGGWLDWLTPFSLLTGAGVVCGYALLGATWLIWKTDGSIQERAFRLAKPAGIATLAVIGLVSLATLNLDYTYREKWLGYPAVLLTAQVPLLTAIIAFAFYRSIRKRREARPFFLALALFLMSFIGLGISMYPYIVPDHLTIWEAAAPASSQWFMLVGAVVLIPIILSYTAFSYWVFRGKVTAEGYH